MHLFLVQALFLAGGFLIGTGSLVYKRVSTPSADPFIVVENHAVVEATVSQICIVYRHLLDMRPSNRVPTFYEALGISEEGPARGGSGRGRDGDQAALDAEAAAKLRKRLKRQYARKTVLWPFACPQGSQRRGWRCETRDLVHTGGVVEEALERVREMKKRGLVVGGGERGDHRAASLLLMTDIMNDPERRAVYDGYFMPSLEGRLANPAAFLKEFCFWDEKN